MRMHLQMGTKSRFVYLMPDYWLEVSLHLEVPATGQLDQGFPWFSVVFLGPRANAELVPIFCVTLLVSSHAASSSMVISKLRSNVAVTKLDETSI
jgi:hypothetical protein